MTAGTRRNSLLADRGGQDEVEIPDLGEKGVGKERESETEHEGALRGDGHGRSG